MSATAQYITRRPSFFFGSPHGSAGPWAVGVVLKHDESPWSGQTSIVTGGSRSRWSIDCARIVRDWSSSRDKMVASLSRSSRGAIFPSASFQPKFYHFSSVLQSCSSLSHIHPLHKDAIGSKCQTRGPRVTQLEPRKTPMWPGIYARTIHLTHCLATTGKDYYCRYECSSISPHA
jgi:hypothetical protein